VQGLSFFGVGVSKVWVVFGWGGHFVVLGSALLPPGILSFFCCPLPLAQHPPPLFVALVLLGLAFVVAGPLLVMAFFLCGFQPSPLFTLTWIFEN